MTVAWICTDGCNLVEKAGLLLWAFLPFIIVIVIILLALFLVKKAHSKNKITASNARLFLKLGTFCIIVFLLSGILKTYSYERSRENTFNDNLFPIYALSTSPDIGTNTLYTNGEYSLPYVWFHYVTLKGTINITEVEASPAFDRLFNPPVCNLDQIGMFVSDGGAHTIFQSNPNDTCELIYQKNDRFLYKDVSIESPKVAPEFIGRIDTTYILFTVEDMNDSYRGTINDAETYIRDFMDQAQVVDPSTLKQW